MVCRSCQYLGRLQKHYVIEPDNLYIYIYIYMTTAEQNVREMNIN